MQPIRQPFQQRVVNEKTELDEKLSSLSLFLVTPTYESLPPNERIRLGRQREVMTTYSDILGERIKAFA